MRGVARGCGTRVAGGVYIVVEPSKNGRPLRDFLLDPPIPIPDPEAMGIAPVGTSIARFGGREMVVDWVGSKHYPNVADFVGEVARFGLSRRVSLRRAAGITPGMPLAVMHARAVLDDRAIPIYWQNIVDHPAGWDGPRIFKGGCQKGHEEAGEMCAGLWWEDVSGGEAILDPDLPYRSVERTLPSFDYRARREPDAADGGLYSPGYRHIPGIFALFPIRSIDVIRDKEGGTHQDALDALDGLGFDLSLEDS